MLKTRRGDIIVGDTGRVNRIIRRGELKTVTGYSIAQIYNLVADGTFPKPIPLGKHAVGWLESDIAAWQAERIAERDAKIGEAANATS